MKRRIKIVRRAMVPETNSSSSHVVAIYSGNYGSVKDLEDFISLDGKTLTIPGGVEFGRCTEEYGDVLSKMQYACYGILGYCKQNRPIFEEVVKDFLGVENIIYNWYDEDEFEEWTEQNPDEEIDNCPLLYGPNGERLDEPPIIDHESVEVMQNMVYESKETLRDFIFSENSWLFSGEETTDPKNYYSALANIGDPLILKLKPDNVSLFSDNEFEKELDFEIYPNFPYTNSSIPLEIYNHRTLLHKWINIGSWDRNISDDTLSVLNSIWAEKKEGKYYLRIGNISNIVPKDRIAVPWVTKDTFKFPFTLKFFPILIFEKKELKVFFEETIRSYLSRGQEDKLDLYNNTKELFSINLIPKFNDIEINEFI